MREPGPRRWPGVFPNALTHKAAKEQRAASDTPANAGGTAGGLGEHQHFKHATWQGGYGTTHASATAPQTGSAPRGRRPRSHWTRSAWLSEACRWPQLPQPQPLWTSQWQLRGCSSCGRQHIAARLTVGTRTLRSSGGYIGLGPGSYGVCWATFRQWGQAKPDVCPEDAQPFMRLSLFLHD